MTIRIPIVVLFLALLPVVSLAGSFHLGHVPDDGIGNAKLKVREFLSKDIGQPFEGGDLRQLRTLDDVARYIVRGFWNRYLSLLDLVVLKDYLDFDSIPTSFIVPSVETCPMVCSVSLSADRFAVKKTQTQSQGYGERVVETTYSIDSSMFNSMSVSAQVVFPFRYASSLRRHDYKCQCIVKFFLANNYDASLRAGNIDEENELSATKDWKGYWTEMSDRTITFLSQEESVSLPDSDELTTDNMTKRVTFDGFSPPHATHERPLLKVARRYALDSSRPPSSTPIQTQYQVGFFPYDTNWNYALSSWRYPSDQQPSYGGWFRPSYAVWVRVIDQYGKTVDVVPATYLDDGIDEPSSFPLRSELTKLCGDRLPLLRFVSDGEFSYAESEFERMTSTGSTDVRPALFSVVDPRYNHAPENWLGTANAPRYGYEDWYDTIRDSLGRYGRDSDPFMFTSDQGYLQSVFELCNLPIAGGLEGSSFGELFRESPTRFDGRVRERVDEIADYDYVWKTYSLPGDSDYEKLPLTYLLETTGENIVHGGISDLGGIPSVEAAVQLLENTPSDWFVAGTNAYDRPSLSTLDFLRHSFNPVYGRREIDNRTLNEIAEKIVAKVNGSFAMGGGNWLAAFDALDWLSPSKPNEIIGVSLSYPLMTAERKFLHSYWRGLLEQARFGTYELILPDDKTEIYSGEFADDVWLTKVTIPENLYRIREGAFRGCSNLCEIVVNSRNVNIDHNAFAGCTSLTNLILGADCDGFSHYQFEECPSLSTFTVYASAERLPNEIGFGLARKDMILNVIGDCDQIKWSAYFMGHTKWTMRIGKGVKSIKERQFANGSQCLTNVVFASTVSTIGKGAFQSSGLINLEIPQGVIVVEDFAFAFCNSLESVRLPASLSVLGERVFAKTDVSKITVVPESPAFVVDDGVLYRLKDGEKVRVCQCSSQLPRDYVLPPTIKSIDSYAFDGCFNLTQLDLPEGFAVLQGNPFAGYHNLSRLGIPESMSQIMPEAIAPLSLSMLDIKGDRFFVECDILYRRRTSDSAKQIVCARLGSADSFSTGDDVAEVLSSALKSSKSLKRLELGTSVESIGSQAFSQCTELSRINFNEGLMSINASAFSGCTNVQAVILPSSVGSLNYDSFRDCSGMRKVVFHCDVPILLVESGLLDNLPEVYWPKAYDAAYGEVASGCPFGGYTDDLIPVMTPEGSLVNVPNEWFAAYGGFEEKFGADRGKALVAKTGKVAADGHEMAVWEDFVAGTDPTDEDDVFKIVDVRFENGEFKITWSPDLNEDGTKSVRAYTTYGCSEIGGEWYNADKAPEEVKSQFRFFKVGVEMK